MQSFGWVLIRITDEHKNSRATRTRQSRCDDFLLAALVSRPDPVTDSFSRPGQLDASTSLKTPSSVLWYCGYKHIIGKKPSITNSTYELCSSCFIAYLGCYLAISVFTPPSLRYMRCELQFRIVVHSNQ